MAKKVGIAKKSVSALITFVMAFAFLAAVNSSASANTAKVGARCQNLNEQEYINNDVLICQANKSGQRVWTKAFTGGSGGTVTIGIGALPPSLEAYAASAPPRSFVVAALYSALTRIDLSTGTPIAKPNVAESWTQQGNSRVWIFNLIQGKTFPNGEPVDATAVKASLDFVLNPNNRQNLRSRIADITRVEVMSQYQVKITTSAPRYLLPRSLGVIPILPPKDFAARGAAAFWQRPIGTGPFVATSFTPNVELVLEPNPFSLRVTPSAKKIIFKVIPEDASRMSGLRAGGLDVVAKVPTDDIKALRARYNVLSITEPATYHMSLLQRTGPMSNKLVRQALNYAVDKNALIRLNGGLGSVAQAQLVPSNLTGFCKEVKAYPYDLKKANALMKQAGVSNLTLTFQTSTAYITNDVLMAQAIAQMIQRLDAVTKVEVEVLEFSKFLDVYNLRGAIPRKDLYAWRMSSSPDLDAGVQMERYTTSYPTHNIGYQNPRYDELVEQARSLSTRSAARTRAFCEAAKILKEDAPILWGIHTPDIWAGKKTTKRFFVDAGGNIDLVSIGN